MQFFKAQVFFLIFDKTFFNLLIINLKKHLLHQHLIKIQQMVAQDSLHHYILCYNVLLFYGTKNINLTYLCIKTNTNYINFETLYIYIYIHVHTCNLIL